MKKYTGHPPIFENELVQFIKMEKPTGQIRVKVDSNDKIRINLCLLMPLPQRKTGSQTKPCEIRRPCWLDQ